MAEFSLKNHFPRRPYVSFLEVLSLVETVPSVSDECICYVSCFLEVLSLLETAPLESVISAVFLEVLSLLETAPF
jgi:hypothetical protein